MRGSSCCSATVPRREIAACGLGDVDRQVADPLEVRVDLDGSHDHAQIDGDRLMQRQKLEGAIVDRHLHRVHFAVANRHLVEPVEIVIDEPLDGRRESRSDDFAFMRKLLLERGEVFEKVRRNRC